MHIYTAVYPKRQAESLNSLERSPPHTKSPPPAPRKIDTPADEKVSIPETKRTSVQAAKSLPKKLVKDLEELLRANPSGIWLSRLTKEFEVSILESQLHFADSLCVCVCDTTIQCT